MTTSTVYCLKDPITQQVRYVGATTCNLRKRMREHLCEANTSQFHNPKVEWLRRLDEPPLLAVLETVPSQLAEERERWWIAHFYSQGADLTNRQDGGRGGPRYHTEEAKAKMRAAALANGAKPPSQRGAIPWNKGTHGIMKANETTFTEGNVPWNKGQTSDLRCSVEGCDRPHYGKTWCSGHYQRWYQTGSLNLDKPLRARKRRASTK